ncbi:hypothetical protein HK104_004664 [Borealophlyctis nickersoniae]|nr:hypothetical protein HK104_004664 [Borealophlyctis nickersoniae]
MPILVSFISGQAAREMEKEDDRTIVSKAMMVLSRIFRSEQPLPQPIETIVTRWSRDEFAHGSYSYIAKDATGDDYDRMAAPVEDKIFWAGEATCRAYPATLTPSLGAMLSGMRVASSIADTLLGPIEHDHYRTMNSKGKGPAGLEDLTECPRHCPHPILPGESIFDHVRNMHKSHKRKSQEGEAEDSEDTHDASGDEDIPSVKWKKLKRDEGHANGDADMRGRSVPDTPKSAYVLFRKDKGHEVRRYLAEQNLKGSGHFNSIINKWWLAATPEEKERYDAKAEAMRSEYLQYIESLPLGNLRISSSPSGSTRGKRQASRFKPGAFKEESEPESAEDDEEDVESTQGDQGRRTRGRNGVL